MQRVGEESVSSPTRTKKKQGPKPSRRPRKRVDHFKKGQGKNRGRTTGVSSGISIRGKKAARKEGKSIGGTWETYQKAAFPIRAGEIVMLLHIWVGGRQRGTYAHRISNDSKELEEETR